MHGFQAWLGATLSTKLGATLKTAEYNPQMETKQNQPTTTNMIQEPSWKIELKT